MLTLKEVVVFSTALKTSISEGLKVENVKMTKMEESKKENNQQ